MTEKIHINGLKKSERLIALWVTASNGSADTMPRFSRVLAAMQINMAFLTTTLIDGLQPALCCIDPGDQPQVTAAIAKDNELRTSVRFQSEAVGLISLYPHKASLNVLGVALQALNDGAITVHGLASSISALTFVTDFACMDQAADILAHCLKLPTDAKPMASELKVRQMRPSVSPGEAAAE